MGLDTDLHLNLRTETISPAGPGPHAPTTAAAPSRPDGTAPPRPDGEPQAQSLSPAGQGPHASTAAAAPSRPDGMPLAESLLPAGREPRFAERRRIAVLEHDRALRPVVIRTLLRLGCVVSAKHELAQVTEALQAGPIDGAVVALAGDGSCLPALQCANVSAVPIVVLLDNPVEPHLKARYPALRFLQKPFDMRELLAQLGLPEKATILYSE